MLRRCRPPADQSFTETICSVVCLLGANFAVGWVLHLCYNICPAKGTCRLCCRLRTWSFWTASTFASRLSARCTWPPPTSSSWTTRARGSHGWVQRIHCWGWPSKGLGHVRVYLLEGLAMFVFTFYSGWPCSCWPSAVVGHVRVDLLQWLAMFVLTFYSGWPCSRWPSTVIGHVRVDLLQGLAMFVLIFYRYQMQSDETNYIPLSAGIRLESSSIPPFGRVLTSTTWWSER